MNDISVHPGTPTINYEQHPSHWGIWGGRAGGRHYRVYMAMAELASREDNGRLRISKRKLYLAANVSSHRGLDVSIEFLSEMGVIEIVDPGTSDTHDIFGNRGRGKAGLYSVRQGGPPTQSSHVGEEDEGDHGTSTGCAAHSVVQGTVGDLGGRSPLPNRAMDRNQDVFVDEPHLLCIIDQMAVEGIDDLEFVSYRDIVERLGLSKSAAWELVERWKRKGIISDAGHLYAELYVMGSSGETIQRIERRNARDEAVRKKALAGEWKPLRMRMHQRFARIQRPGSRWCQPDWEWSTRVAQAQRERLESEGVPWLEDEALEGLRESFGAVVYSDVA